VKWLRRAVGALLALVILFEEWGWEPLQRSMVRLARLSVFGAIERWVGRLSPGPALATFLVPSLMLVPVKLAALWFIGEGQPMMGLAVLLLAKLVGTAVVARLFALTKPALLTLPRFAAVYARWSVFKADLLARVRGSWAWRMGRAMRRRIRRWGR
jgi:hypothetical protein